MSEFLAHMNGVAERYGITRSELAGIIFEVNAFNYPQPQVSPRSEPDILHKTVYVKTEEGKVRAIRVPARSSGWISHRLLNKQNAHKRKSPQRDRCQAREV